MPMHQNAKKISIDTVTIGLTLRFVSELPVHKALPSADKPKQLIRPSCEFWRDPKFKTAYHRKSNPY